MKYIIKESQYVHLLENLEKNKKFLTNLMGIDFTGKIEQITSSYDVPMEFDQSVSHHAIRHHLNSDGPMYLFKLFGKKYLYQDKGQYDLFIDEDGYYYNDEIAQQLGIDVLGLRFSNIIDIYFNEGESLNENVDKKKRLFTKILGEDLIDSIREITSPNQLPIEFLKSIGTSVIQRYIDVYGPLYYFVLDGEPFLYKERISPRGEEYEMYITDKGKSYLEGEITDRLGLSDMGLNFSDVIDTIFNEGQSLNESLIFEETNKSVKLLKKYYDIEGDGAYYRGENKIQTLVTLFPKDYDDEMTPDNGSSICNWEYDDQFNLIFKFMTLPSDAFIPLMAYIGNTEELEEYLEDIHRVEAKKFILRLKKR